MGLGAGLVAAGLGVPLSEGEEGARAGAGWLALGLVQVCGYAAALGCAFVAARVLGGWEGVSGSGGGGGFGRGLMGGLVGWVGAMPWLLVLGIVVGVVGRWLAEMSGSAAPEVVAHETLRELVSSGVGAGWWLMVVAVVVGAPVIEEVIYRGFLQGGLVRLLGGRRWWAIVLGAAVFSGVHAGSVDASGFVILFAVGLVLGLMRERTGGLTGPVVFHGLFNASNVALAMLGAGG